jgi:4-methylaminobutanoate oxidase (formaldehyde-forming)
MLNPDGGIETDLTVVCIENNHFRIISSAATRERDKFHIKKHLSRDIELKDITDELCVFGLFGPKSRDLIKKISKDNFDNEDFKFGTAKLITVEGIKIWTQRLSYVGELGYELYIEFKDAKKIYELIIKRGKDFNLSNCGMHAMDILRMESGFLHWGHDISPEENQYQAGLNFAISYKKPFDFVGKEKLLEIKDQKLDRRFIMLALKDSKPGNPLLLHEEPIYLDDKIIGKTTSGNYSFNYNKNLSFGYIKSDFPNEQLKDRKIFIEIEKKKYQANLLLKPFKQSNYKKI